MRHIGKYTDELRQRRSEVQAQLEAKMQEYDVHSVGKGFIDVIVLRDRVDSFISELTKLKLAVEFVTWWCHATEENGRKFGCPHGYGGPKTKFGWFSEITWEDSEVDKRLIETLESENTVSIVKQINESVAGIIKSKHSIKYMGELLSFDNGSCLTPGLWIRVPDEWERGHPTLPPGRRRI